MEITREQIESLSDEQLLLMLDHALFAAFKRSESLLAQATLIFKEAEKQLSNKVKAQAEFELKAKEEAEKQTKLWAKKKEIAEKALEIFKSDDVTINVWMKDGEKRVYVQTTSKKRKAWKGDDIATYFATGNHKNPPQSLIVERGNLDKEAVKAFLSDIAKGWNGLHLDIATAL